MVFDKEIERIGAAGDSSHKLTTLRDVIASVLPTWSRPRDERMGIRELLPHELAAFQVDSEGLAVPEHSYDPAPTSIRGLEITPNPDYYATAPTVIWERLSWVARHLAQQSADRPSFDNPEFGKFLLVSSTIPKLMYIMNPPEIGYEELEREMFLDEAIACTRVLQRRFVLAHARIRLSHLMQRVPNMEQWVDAYDRGESRESLQRIYNDSVLEARRLNRRQPIHPVTNQPARLR